MSQELVHSYSAFIKASPEQVWEALIKPELTTQYNFGGAANSDWRTGSDYVMTSADGASVLYSGKVLVSDPPRHLAQTVNIKFNPAWAGHEEMTIDWEIDQFGEACQVTIRHRAPDSAAQPFERLTSHCPRLLSGLKTLLETGKPLRIGEPAVRRP